jgi:hypothetical protein
MFIGHAAVCGEFVGYSDVDIVYKLGRHEAVIFSSFYIKSDIYGIPSSGSLCSNLRRGKFFFMIINQN